MRDPNEPSINDCGAPWNEDDEGNCVCSRCARAARLRARGEREEDKEDDR